MNKETHYHIPKKWSYEELGKYFTIQSGEYFPYEVFSSKGIPVLKIDNVMHGKIDWETTTYLPKDYTENIQHLILNMGDIVLALNRPITHNLVKVARLGTYDHPSILYQRVGRFLVKKEGIVLDYLYHFLNSLIFKKIIINISIGSDQPYIKTTELLRQKLPIPSQPEQKEITLILSSLDAVIKQTELVINKTKNFQKGLMQILLIDGLNQVKFNKLQSRLKKLIENSDSWKLTEIQKFLKINMGQSPPSQSYNEKRHGLPFFQGVSDFGKMYPMPSVWCTEPQKIAEKNQILFSVRAPVGETNISDQKCCLGRGVASLDPSQNDLFFCYYLVKYYKRKFYELSQGTTYDAINKDELANTKLPFSKNKIEQQEIAKILLENDKKLVAEENYLNKLLLFRTGLLNDLIMGKINVNVK